MRRTLITLAASGALLAIPLAASAQTPTTFRANITQANESGGSATADLSLDGNDLTVRISGQGFFDGFPHAMHFHGEPGGDNVCGPLNPGDPRFDEADEDGDGFLSVVEGVPAYGPISVSLTTEGDTSPDSGLAVDRFPTSGTLDYERTFEVTDDVADNLSSLHIVIHGADLDGSGEIGDLEDDNGEPKPSSIAPDDFGFEETAVAACGQITAVAAGGVATGAGGSSDSGSNTGAIAAGALGLAALGTLGARRRKATA